MNVLKEVFSGNVLVVVAWVVHCTNEPHALSWLLSLRGSVNLLF